jgi:hypothetical protein
LARGAEEGDTGFAAEGFALDGDVAAEEDEAGVVAFG